jgi:hypothetical protein
VTLFLGSVNKIILHVKHGIDVLVLYKILIILFTYIQSFFRYCVSIQATNTDDIFGEILFQMKYVATDTVSQHGLYSVTYSSLRSVYMNPNFVSCDQNLCCATKFWVLCKQAIRYSIASSV